MHKQLYRLLRLSEEGLVRLKLAGVTVTTGVQLFYKSEVEIFFLYFSLPMRPGHTQQRYEMKKSLRKAE